MALLLALVLMAYGFVVPSPAALAAEDGGTTGRGNISSTDPFKILSNDGFSPKQVKGYAVRGRIIGGDIPEGFRQVSQSAHLTKVQLPDGTVINAYCINRPVNVRGGADYDLSVFENEKADWIPAANGDKIRRVVDKGYPNVTVETLMAAAGIGGFIDSDNNRRREALTATQAAIWHYTENLDVKWSGSDDWNMSRFGGPQQRDRMKKMYDYLLKVAEESPKKVLDFELKIDPEAASGKSNSNIGPFTVSTNGDEATLELVNPPAGVVLYKNSSPLEPAGTTTAVSNGDEFFVHVPAGTPDGSVTLSLSGVSEVPAGTIVSDRLGVNYKYPDKNNKLRGPFGQQLVISDGGGAIAMVTTAEATWEGEEAPI
ncbi:Cys-Gln thioester bond-forming surface protein, partial [Corynebacterium pygosceleis]|uniref:Cys-Gln thioester bond-forming surface protein n=1 Tax=Corynebacterium pygosceleis TaxID=2800406 RepID=UPI001A276216|nr:thioester domain-containing protein [Corynebacterium pygosceleis]